MTNPATLESFYCDGREADRLSTGIGRLEAARTLELLARFLPAVPSDLFDVGGATGHYAAILAEQNYRVRLLDAVPAHVESARSRCLRLVSAEVGDARRLPWPAACSWGLFTT